MTRKKQLKKRAKAGRIDNTAILPPFVYFDRLKLSVLTGGHDSANPAVKISFSRFFTPFHFSATGSKSTPFSPYPGTGIVGLSIHPKSN